MIVQGELNEFEIYRIIENHGEIGETYRKYTQYQRRNACSVFSMADIGYLGLGNPNNGLTGLGGVSGLYFTGTDAAGYFSVDSDDRWNDVASRLVSRGSLSGARITAAFCCPVSYQAATAPQTDQPRAVLWLWLIQALILDAVLSLVIGGMIQRVWTFALPFFTAPPGYEMQELTKTPEQWVGAWYLVGLMVIHIVVTSPHSLVHFQS